MNNKDQQPMTDSQNQQSTRDSPLLEVEDLTIKYETKEGPLTAVSDVSFTVDDGEYFGLVGESGCGKSTVVKSLIGGLDDNGEIKSGKIRYKGEEIQNYSETQLNQQIRWSEISYIPQSSMNSLDPLQRVSHQALEIAQVHTEMTKTQAFDKFEELFEIVGLQKSRIHDYPHQFSGGMQQRAIIALGLFLNPSLIVADEPTTALDVIMQDQIFKYLDDIRDDFDTSMVMITHDISLIFESCDKMSIMHSGQIAETGSVEDVFDSPRHPYSILLQEAFPDIRYPNRELATIDGYPPKTMGDVDNCTFASRCPWAVEKCRSNTPNAEVVKDEPENDEHTVNCFRSDEVHELFNSEDSNLPQQEN